MLADGVDMNQKSMRLLREQQELKAPQRKDHSLREQHPVATTTLKLPVCRSRLKPCPRNASAWNGNPQLILTWMFQ